MAEAIGEMLGQIDWLDGRVVSRWRWRVHWILDLLANNSFSGPALTC